MHERRTITPSDQENTFVSCAIWSTLEKGEFRCPRERLTMVRSWAPFGGIYDVSLINISNSRPFPPEKKGRDLTQLAGDKAF